MSAIFSSSAAANPNADRKTSEAGFALIKRYESFCATLYLCPAGIPTIGYGHAIKPGETFGRLTEAQAKEILKSDVAIAEAGLKHLVTVPLSQGQFDAITSFVFNLGARNFARSTLLKVINLGQFELVPAELKRWVFAKGKRLEGLVTRRTTEGGMFAKT